MAREQSSNTEDVVTAEASTLRGTIEDANRRTIASGLFLFVFAMYLASATHAGVVSVDVVSSAVPAWAIAEAGTLDLSAVPPGLVNMSVELGQIVTVDGALYSSRNPGVIAFGVPFYALNGLVSDAGFAMWPQATAGALAAAGTVLALFLTMDRLADRVRALVGALVFAFGTGTWSVSADALWGHGPAQMFLALSLLALASERYAGAGSAFGIALTMRPYSGVAAAVTGLYHSLQRRSMRPAVAIGLTSALGLAAFLLYTRLVFLVWSLYGGYAGREYLSRNVETTHGLLQLPQDIFWALVHPVQGLLVYSPFIIVLAIGVPAAWQKAPPWVRSAFIGGVAFLLAQLYANTWDAGDTFFGYRYPLEFLVLAAPMGLLAFEHGIQPRPVLSRILPHAIAISIALHFVGAVVEPYKG